MDFSIEYAVSKQVVVVNKSADRIKSADDIKEDTKVGVQQGTVADFYFTDDVKLILKDTQNSYKLRKN